MRRLKLVLLVCVVLHFNDSGDCAMTDAQLKSAVRLVRNLCQPKTKATDEDIAKMHAGDWNIDHTAMCYMECAIKGQRLVRLLLMMEIHGGFSGLLGFKNLQLEIKLKKDNTFDFDAGMVQAKKTLPVSIRERAIKAMTKCANSAVTLNDGCVASYELAKCFYEADPEIYFLP